MFFRRTFKKQFAPKKASKQANKQMRYMNLKPLIIIGVMQVLSFPVYSQEAHEKQKDAFCTVSEQKTELVLHFRFDRSIVDYGYRDNRRILTAMHELFADSLCLSRIDSVCIQAFSSPEGNAAYNQRLALKRARAVKGYLVWKYPRLPQQRIRTSAQAESWEALKDIIQNDTLLPCRDEVLQILELNTTETRKEALLKKLNAGTPYRYLRRQILPQVRNASICTVYMGAEGRDKAEATGTSGADNAGVTDTCHSERSEESPLTSITGNTGIADNASITSNTPRRPLFALKTNLLFDAALMPNIELELPIGKRWSLNAEYMFPWWRINDDRYCLQILMGGLEGRYWFGKREKREVLTGHFAGLYAGGGKYDLQWDTKGYQGEFFIAAGISYGYAHPIARNLRLEYNIGIGMLRTNYRHYHTRDNHRTLLWQENGEYTWLGPTKLKVSLVWLINRKTKK